MKRIRYVFIIVIFLIIVYTIYTAVSIYFYGNTDEKCKADTAIVLGASTSENKISPVFEERINHGIWLYNNGYVDKIIMTGGYGKGNTMSDAQTAKEYALSCGVPDKDVLVEEKSVITQENLENSKVIMDENNYSTALIVSDPLHMKRAMLLANDCGIKAYSSPTPTSAYKSMKSKIPFLLREIFFYIGYEIYRIFI